MFEHFDDRWNHMGFATPDGGLNPDEFCCIFTGGLWKLHHREGNIWRRVRTGLPKDATECGPTAEWADNMLKISFIAGGWEGDRTFRLYRMYGLDSGAVIQCPADVGFVRKSQVVYAGRRGPIIISEPDRTVTLELPKAEFLYRVSYDPFAPNRLLISGQFNGGEIFSWRYRPGMKKLEKITDGGEPCYKCAFWHDECYYARRIAGFEERRIIRAEQLEITSLNADDFIVETEKAGRMNENIEAEFE